MNQRCRSAHEIQSTLRIRQYHLEISLSAWARKLVTSIRSNFRVMLLAVADP